MREARRGGIVLLATLAAAFGLACERAPAAEQETALPLAEVQVTSLPRAVATLPVPASPGQAVPSRYDEPIGPDRLGGHARPTRRRDRRGRRRREDVAVVERDHVADRRRAPAVT
jgi:hypothetical protein